MIPGNELRKKRHEEHRHLWIEKIGDEPLPIDSPKVSPFHFAGSICISGFLLRIICRPRYPRYAAPAHLTTPKAKEEATRIAESPRAAAVV